MASRTTIGLATLVMVCALGFGTVDVSAATGPYVSVANPSQQGAPGDTALAGLEIVAVSPWVGSEGTFEVRFEVPPQWPAGTSITATIQQRLRPEDSGLRASADAMLAEAPSTRNLQAPLSFELDSLTNSTGTATLTIPVRSGSGAATRTFIPSAGIHPVDVRAVDPSGDVLAESVVYLNRLPDDPQTGRDMAPAQSSVTLLAGLDSSPALGLDGEPILSTEETLAIAPWQDMIGRNTDLPLTIALRPNTLLALQRSSTTADQNFINKISATTKFTFAPQSYVRVDAAGLQELQPEELTSQVRLGASLLTDLTNVEPSGPWILDDTVDESTARTLSSLGVRHLLVSQDRLVLDESVPIELASQRTMKLAGVPNTTVSTYDAPASRLLVDAALSPALNAHRASTALMASWFDAIAAGTDTFPGVSAALLVSPSVERDTLVALVESLMSNGAVRADMAPLRVAQSGEASVSADGSPVRASLSDLDNEIHASVIRRKRAVTARINGFTTIAPAAATDAAQWHLLNDQTLAISSGDVEREELWRGIDTEIDRRLASVDIPARRNVVLTARSGSIPVRIRNGLDTEVRLQVTARSPRLEFPEGSTTEILLEPGENLINLPVQVQAPGSSLLRIEFRSPDGSIELPTTTVTVRSSSISGVGAALSVISLIVLGLWWIRTHRARKRARVDAGEGQDNSSQGGAPDTGTVEVPVGAGVPSQGEGQVESTDEH